MIADLAKYITTLRNKGHELFNSYLALKKHLDQLKMQLEKLHGEEKQQQGKIAKVRAEMEQWKGKARELQTQLDELKTRYHDLEKEHKVSLLFTKLFNFSLHTMHYMHVHAYICIYMYSFCTIFRKEASN